MTILLTTIAIISLYMLLHNFVFPLYLKVISVFIKQPGQADPGSVKKISIIVPVYNEEDCIAEKLANLWECTRQLPCNFEVLIGADGCTDATCQIVKSYIEKRQLENWQLLEFPNEGKCQTINKLVQASHGDVIVSTDADTDVNHTALRIITDRFLGDDRLGCLSCVPRHRFESAQINKLYWSFEVKVRELESRLGMLIVTTGWLYAYRKDLFVPIPCGVMADDLWIPLTIVLQGFRSVHETRIEAVSERTDDRVERTRRTRVIVGGIDVVSRLFREICRRPLLFFLVFSHKINKWLLPLWITGFVLSTVMLSNLFLIAYVVSFGFLLILFSPRKIFTLIYSCFSPILSFTKFVAARDFSRWEHLRK